MRILLYYKYIDVPNPAKEVTEHLVLCKSLGLKGRILIGSEGINGTCSGTVEACEAYKKALNEHPIFSGINFKESDHSDHVFQKIFVRLRPEVVTLGANADPKKAAPYITPRELHEALERGDNLVLIDMRNDYEAAIGKFQNAITLPIENFRDLPSYMQNLEQYKDADVVTYCTGGIRCEKASALLLHHGFKSVRQLEGGIVKYCEEFPNGFYDGSLFVFDKRMCMRFPGQETKYISTCNHCKKPCDRYINCNEASCHRLFLCCEECEPIKKSICEKHSITDCCCCCSE